MKILALAFSVIATTCTVTANANDFPTQARVEYVLRCMDAHGGQKYENLYSCVCAIDKIAGKIDYEEFVESEVFVHLRGTAGERGGVFRDPPKARSLYKKFQSIVRTAEKSCFVTTVKIEPDAK